MATIFQPSGASANDLLEILRQDHLKVDELFGQFANAADEGEKRRVVEQIALELLPHAQAEEEIFYPALRNAMSDESSVDEAYQEHAAARKTLQSILDGAPSDMTHDVKVATLQKEIQHHVREEETVLFQEARDAGLDLDSLGHQLMQRKMEIKQSIRNDLGLGATPQL